MDRRTREAVRYLGYKNHAVDDHTLFLVRSSFQELEQEAQKRIIYRIFDLRTNGRQQIMIGNMTVESRSLSKNLKGCGQVLMLGATLGNRVDQLLRRYSLNEMARAVVIQACAAAFLEEYLDDWQKEMKKDLLEEGIYLRPRFSPGYGDFSIRHQQEILRMLDAAKTIGLTMTESCMLVPSKSVTAVIGMSRKYMECHRKGCEACDKIDCEYRRDT